MLEQRNSKHFKFAAVSSEHASIMMNSDVHTLREHLFKGTFTSVDLVNFFGDRSQTIGRQLCLSTEELFEEAMDMAKKCDLERAEAVQNGKEQDLPFLHGIPFSVKELFAMKGRLSTVGCAMLNQPRETDSECFTPLIEAGGIPLVRGNVP